MVFYIKNCRCRIEFSFLLMASLALVTGTKSIFLVMLFASLHEAGHLLLLYCFHGRAQALTLSFYGIGLKHYAAFTKWQEAMFLLGGIAVNGLFVLLNIHREINLPLLVLNALPIYPLDGGRALALLIGETAVKYISVAMLLLLVIYAVYCHNAALIMIALYILVYSVYKG